MSEESFQEKTEEPTKKKILDRRKKGLVAKSQELTSSLMLFFGVIILFFWGKDLFYQMSLMVKGVFFNLSLPIDTPETCTYWFRKSLKHTVFMVLPFLSAMFLVAYGSSLIQVGFVFSTESIKPKWNSINIFNPRNYKKLFDLKAFARLITSVGKVIIISSVSVFFILKKTTSFRELIHQSTDQVMRFVFWNSFVLGVYISLILLVLGGMDYLFQKWKFKQEMKMTKQEVKDERKSIEGDGRIKSKIRSMMEEVPADRMKKNTLDANVVIAHLNRFAVALKYDSEMMEVPICVAKGMQTTAMIIKESADKHRIPIVENALLAESLYRSVRAGEAVSKECYQGVAEVMAYVYRLDQKPESLKR